MTAKHNLPFFGLAALAFAVALPACSPEDPSLDLAAGVDDETTLESSRSGELPCVVYCQARADEMRERCEQAGNEAGLCAELAAEHAGACGEQQCSLMVELPGIAELEELARVVGHELLGEDYELVTTIPHYYDGESVGSRVYVFESGLDQSRGFVEMGATLELPPVISYGHGEVAEVALAEHAIARLSEFYGPHEYQLVRSHFTAIHPVLEFESAYGSFFYDAAADDISHVFAVSDDPDPDEQAQMIRAQSFLRQWDSYLNQP